MSIKYCLPSLNIILRNNAAINSFRNTFQLQKRYSSYQNSKIVGNNDEYTSKFEITKSAEDWKYVERILAPLKVPEPSKKNEYSSGWTPQSDSVENVKYFVQRNKNYMVPVYLETSHRGMRKITKIRRIQGDIFQLEQDLKNHFESNLKKEIATQVNELVGYIHIKGDHVSLVKDYLVKKGF